MPVREQLADVNVVRGHIQKVVEGCRKILGLKGKFFIMDPETSAQDALLLWEKREEFDTYLKSEEYKASVLNICQGEPRVEV